MILAKVTGHVVATQKCDELRGSNLLTGIGSCHFDSSPALFITGQVNRSEQKGDRRLDHAPGGHKEGAARLSTYLAGLGLALVDSIAREHGGSVKVLESNEKGSIIALMLPVSSLKN